MKGLGDERNGEAAMRVAQEQGSSSQVEKCPKCEACPDCGLDPRFHYEANREVPKVLTSKAYSQNDLRYIHIFQVCHLPF